MFRETESWSLEDEGSSFLFVHAIVLTLAVKKRYAILDDFQKCFT